MTKIKLFLSLIKKSIKNKQGISMPEIMAGLSVIAILTGTGVTSAVNQINRAKLTATMDEMKAISEALMQYHVDHPGDTISTITTLETQGYLTEGFTDAPDPDLETNWKQDAWNNPYQLIPPSVDLKGNNIRGSLESSGTDGVLTDDPITSADETDDNIKISLEPMISGN